MLVGKINWWIFFSLFWLGILLTCDLLESMWVHNLQTGWRVKQFSSYMVYSLDLTRVFCSVTGFQFANMPKILYLCKIKCRNYISWYVAPAYPNIYIYIYIYICMYIYLSYFLYCNNCLNFKLFKTDTVLNNV